MDPEHHPKLNPVRAYKSFHDCSLDPTQLEPTSLSDLLDYEPSLEFDDSELQQTGETGLAPLPPELLVFNDMLGRSSSDGTIEENFEKELGNPPDTYPEISEELLVSEDFFEDIPIKGLVEIIGDDKLGRRVVTINTFCLPPTSVLHPNKVLRYLIYVLDKYVEQDYVVVYYHSGLNDTNSPRLLWLWQAYKTFDRKYKKNLKGLYIVHPTNLIRLGLRVLQPLISIKFFSGKKLTYINYLHELGEHLNLESLVIPEQVIEFERKLAVKERTATLEGNKKNWRLFGHSLFGARAKAEQPEAGGGSSSEMFKPSQQFGVSLYYIRDNNPNVVDSIPPIVRHCVEYLSNPDALETEGLFRRSTTAPKLRLMMEQCNNGIVVDFNNDPHLAAVLLKSFFRELAEPILTFDVFDDVIKFPQSTEKHEDVKRILLEKLPGENYKLLKYVAKFLVKVADRSCMNRMSLSNLAVVFGPNLLWPPEGRFSLEFIEPVNAFTDYMLAHHEEFFYM